jgi:hypothetical protein
MHSVVGRHWLGMANREASAVRPYRLASGTGVAAAFRAV